LGTSSPAVSLFIVARPNGSLAALIGISIKIMPAEKTEGEPALSEQPEMTD
jgi:hypothetical protein